VLYFSSHNSSSHLKDDLDFENLLFRGGSTPLPKAIEIIHSEQEYEN
jgi:hypothetical protein